MHINFAIYVAISIVACDKYEIHSVPYVQIKIHEVLFLHSGFSFIIVINLEEI